MKWAFVILIAGAMLSGVAAYVAAVHVPAAELGIEG